MKTYTAIVLYFILLFTASIYAQTTTNDTVLKNTKTLLEGNNRDKRAELLIAYSLYHLNERSLDSCRHYAQEAIKVAEFYGRQDIVQEANWYIGRSYFFEFDFERTIQYMEKAEQGYAINKDTIRLVKILNTKGLSMRNLGNYEASIPVFKSSLSMAEQVGNKSLMIINSINLGASYKSLESDTLAVTYYTKALKLAEEEKDSLHLGIIITNFGNIYSSLEQNDLARSYYKRAEAIHLNQKDYAQLGLIWGNLAHLDLKNKDYDSAIENARKTLEIGDSTFIPVAAIIVSHSNLGEAYLRKKEYQNSRNNLDKAIAVSLKNKVPIWLEEIYKLRAALEKETGNLESAYKYLEMYIQIKDSILDNNVVPKFNLEETQSELYQKKKEITLLEEDNSMAEKENQSLRGWLLTVSLVVLSLFGLIYIYYLKQKSERLSLRKAAAENKLEALRNQMNPHFLFNSFNAIQHYILKSEKDNAYNYLTRVAFLIRKVLDNASSMTIDLEEEVEILETYVKLEALRFQDKFTYTIKVDDTLVALNPTIPSMIIQPYIENAILHGLSNKENGNGKLSVHIRSVDEQRIRCVIEDNGIGRVKALEIKASKPKDMQGNSIAMNNTDRRLQILEKAGYPHGKVAIEDLYTADNTPTGTRVSIELNMI
ncbi:MAG: tetratricopeptide repeat protein [Bacteroidota bacterium]